MRALFSRRFAVLGAFVALVLGSVLIAPAAYAAEVTPDAPTLKPSNRCALTIPTNPNAVYTITVDGVDRPTTPGEVISFYELTDTVEEFKVTAAVANAAEDVLAPGATSEWIFDGFDLFDCYGEVERWASVEVSGCGAVTFTNTSEVTLEILHSSDADEDWDTGFEIASGANKTITTKSDGMFYAVFFPNDAEDADPLYVDAIDGIQADCEEPGDESGDEPASGPAKAAHPTAAPASGV